MTMPSHVVTGSNGGNNVTTLDLSITTQTQTDSVLICWPGHVDTGAYRNVSSVVIDPGGGDEESFTYETRAQITAGSYFSEECWYLIDPPVGSYTVRITWVSQVTRGIGIVSQYKDAHQTDPIGVTNATSGNSDPKTVSVTTGTANSMVLGGFMLNDAVQTASSGTTEIGEYQQTAFTDWSGEKPAATTGAYTISCYDGTSAAYATVGVELLEAAAGPGALSITESDSVTVGESTTIDPLLLAGIVESDSVTVGDTATMYMGIEVSQTDAVTLGESTTISPLILADIVESDAVTVTDTPTVQTSDPQITESDTVTVSDNASLYIGIDISESDAVTVTDTPSLDIGDLAVSVADAVTLGESQVINVTVFGVLDISVADSVTLGESQTIQVSDPNITVVDSVTLGESQVVTIVAVGILTISVADAVSLGESQTIQVSDPQVTETDAVTIADVASLYMGIGLSASDSVTVADAATMNIGDLVVSVADAITLGESQIISVISFLDLSIAVSDSVAVSDEAIVYLTRPGFKSSRHRLRYDRLNNLGSAGDRYNRQRGPKRW